MTVEENIRSLGLALPEAANPLATYVPAVQAGNLVFTSGQLPTRNNALVATGRIPDEVSPEDGYEAAKVAVLNALAAIKGVIGDLDRVVKVVRLNGYVNSLDGFGGQPTIINGASDLLVQIFGDMGKHSRVSVGVSGLPLDASVELDLIVEVD